MCVCVCVCVCVFVCVCDLHCDLYKKCTYFLVHINFYISELYKTIYIANICVL